MNEFKAQDLKDLLKGTDQSQQPLDDQWKEVNEPPIQISTCNTTTSVQPESYLNEAFLEDQWEYVEDGKNLSQEIEEDQNTPTDCQRLRKTVAAFNALPVLKRFKHCKVQVTINPPKRSKGLTKKLNQLANARGMEKVGMWRKSVINHLHWVASSTPSGNGNVMLEKWSRLLNHVVDVHQGHGQLFPACEHEPLTVDQRKEKEWFVRDSAEYSALCKVLDNKQLLKDVRKMSPLHQTSNLEAFHSLILRFCPKHTAFSWLGMYCRLFLAALHYNENSEREYQLDESGCQKYRIVFPKAKRESTV